MENNQEISGIAYLVATGIVLILLLIGVVIIYASYARQRILRQQLALKEKETKHQEELINNTILVLEDERSRFAKDLHDDIGSLFSALRLQVNQIDIQSDAKVKEAVFASSDLIDSGMRRMRQIAHNVAPPDLQMFGLPDILETYCDKQSTPKLELSFSYQHPYRKMGDIEELAIYRITQELCNNSTRHAQASKIRIELHQTPANTIYTYSDNGKGFDFAAVYKNPKSGLGLRNIVARVHHIHGTVNWNTHPNAGFSVQINLPV
jgi:two-component system, NarL family, sensor kinase